MADDKRIPRARVDSGKSPDVVEAEAHVMDDEAAADGKKGAAAGAGSTASEPFREAGRRVGGWVSSTFPGHENAFWGGVFGFVIGVLIFWVGLFEAVVVAVLVLVGVALGQAADGDPKIINLFRQFFSSNN